jgi:hypothetical protein
MTTYFVVEFDFVLAEDALHLLLHKWIFHVSDRRIRVTGGHQSETFGRGLQLADQTGTERGKAPGSDDEGHDVLVRVR